MLLEFSITSASPYQVFAVHDRCWTWRRPDYIFVKVNINNSVDPVLGSTKHNEGENDVFKDKSHLF